MTAAIGTMNNRLSEPLVGLVDVDVLIHHHLDVEETVKRSEFDECTEFRDLDDLSLDDLVLFEPEHQLVEHDVEVHRTVTVNDASVVLLVLPSDILDEDRDRFVLSEAALVLFQSELLDDLVHLLDVVLQS